MIITKKKDEHPDGREDYRPDMLEFSQTAAPLQHSDSDMLEFSQTAAPVQHSDSDMLEFSQTTVSRQLSDDARLSAAEAASIDILALLREQRDEENALLTVAERTFVEDVPPSEATAPVHRPAQEIPPRRGLSPWWLAAAVTIGFALGFAMPRTASSPTDDTVLSHSTDTLQGRSLASGDVNTFLLVSL